MKLRSAEAFCRVIELGGIGPAAQTMFCVPSNITKMIKELENDLSEPLFERYKGRLIVTPFGRSYYQDVKPLVDFSSEIDKKYQKNNGYSSLTIGAIDVASDYWLPPKILLFMQANNHIQVNLINAHSRVLEDGLIDRKFDLIFSDGPIENPEITSALAFEERLILIGEPDAVSHSPIPLYTFGRECLYSDMVTDWLTTQPVGKYQFIIIESYQTMLSLAENHLGVAFIPERVLEKYSATTLSQQTESIACDVHIAWHRSIKHKAIATMLDFIQIGHE